MASLRKSESTLEVAATIQPRRSKKPLTVMISNEATELGADVFRIINERVRLGILSSLAVNPRLSFAELKSMLDTTDGNLSMHARKLEDAGFIATAKTFRDRRPLTEFALTTQGREGLLRYLNHMESLIARMKETTR